jgi:hypothetical protein
MKCKIVELALKMLELTFWREESRGQLPRVDFLEENGAVPQNGELWEIQLPGYLPLSEGWFIPWTLYEGRERVSAQESQVFFDQGS